MGVWDWSLRFVRLGLMCREAEGVVVLLLYTIRDDTRRYDTIRVWIFVLLQFDSIHRCMSFGDQFSSVELGDQGAETVKIGMGSEGRTASTCRVISSRPGMEIEEMEMNSREGGTALSFDRRCLGLGHCLGGREGGTWGWGWVGCRVAEGSSAFARTRTRTLGGGTGPTRFGN